jgi:hypothetical protein
MAKRKKKVSAYTRNRNRINSYIRRLNKKGLITNLYFPTERELKLQGIKGAELTRYTNELKKVTSDFLKGESIPIPKTPQNFNENGDLKVGDDGMFNRTVIADIKNNISHYPKEIADKVTSLIDQLVTEQGIDDVVEAIMLASDLHYYFNKYQYDSESAIQDYATGIINALPNASDQYKMDLADAFEFNELGYTIED